MIDVTRGFLPPLASSQPRVDDRNAGDPPYAPLRGPRDFFSTIHEDRARLAETLRTGREQRYQPIRERGAAAEVAVKAMMGASAAKMVLDTGRVLTKYREAVPSDGRWRSSRLTSRRLLRSHPEGALTPQQHRRLNLLRTPEGRSFVRQAVTNAPELSILDPEAPRPAADAPRVRRAGPLGAIGRAEQSLANRLPASSSLRAKIEGQARSLASAADPPSPAKSFSRMDARLMRVSNVAGLGLLVAQAPSAVVNLADAWKQGFDGTWETRSGRTGTLQAAGSLIAGGAAIEGARYVLGRRAAELASAEAVEAAGSGAARVAQRGGVRGALGVAKSAMSAPIWNNKFVARSGPILGVLTLANELGAFDFLDRRS